jgi:hypothetical protein
MFSMRWLVVGVLLCAASALAENRVSIPYNCFENRAREAAKRPGAVMDEGRVRNDPLPAKLAKALIAQGRTIDRAIVAYLHDKPGVEEHVATAMFAGDVVPTMHESAFRLYSPHVDRISETEGQQLLEVYPWSPWPRGVDDYKGVYYIVTVNTADGRVVKVTRPNGEMPAVRKK